MKESQAPVRRGRGRRPEAEVRRAVLAATGEILFESGLGGVTFEKVAARSCTSKMTLYKYWPSPGALALEGYFAATEQTLAFPDTGDIERDLKSQLRAFVRLLTGDQLWGACYHRLLLPAETLDFTFTDALVSNLMRGTGCETPDEK